LLSRGKLAQEQQIASLDEVALLVELIDGIAAISAVGAADGRS
jgi:hypothetical protein